MKDFIAFGNLQIEVIFFRLLSKMAVVFWWQDRLGLGLTTQENGLTKFSLQMDILETSKLLLTMHNVKFSFTFDSPFTREYSISAIF
jgi:hypothetical protein